MTVSGQAANRRPLVVVTRSPRITYSVVYNGCRVPDLTADWNYGP